MFNNARCLFCIQILAPSLDLKEHHDRTLIGTDAYRLSCTAELHRNQHHFHKRFVYKIIGILFEIRRPTDKRYQPLVLKTHDKVIWNKKLGWAESYGKQPLAYGVESGNTREY